MVTVTQQEVDDYIVNTEVIKVGRKTTHCLLTLKNGYEVVGTSACVDADNYNHDVGTEYAVKRAKDRVWELLGFMKQSQNFTNE